MLRLLQSHRWVTTFYAESKLPLNSEKKGKIVIFGGYQSNFSQKDLSDYSDSVVHGNPGPKFMSSLLSDAENNNLKKEYYCGIDVNFPFDYSILESKKISFIPVLSSVGCAYDCDFCCTAAIYNGCYRLRSIDCVMKDLLKVNKISGKAGFVDNNIYNNREYLLVLLRSMLREKISLKWGAQATVNIGDDTETLHYLYKAGCRVLFIGMESLNQDNLNDVNKNFTAEDYRNKIKNVHDAGIKLATYFIYGFDNDTKDTVSELYRFINSTGIEMPLLNFLTPAPGTRVYEKLKNEGRLLFENDRELLNKKYFYNSACSTCFFIPQLMTIGESEKNFFKLYRKLAGYLQIIKRSVNINPFMMSFLLGMNIVFRLEYLNMKKKQYMP